MSRQFWLCQCGSALTIVFFALLIAGCPPAKMVAVPDVAGLTQSAAEAAITAAGLTVGTVSLEYSESVPDDSVVSQDPAAGTSVARGTAIDLSVSMGPSPGDGFKVGYVGSERCGECHADQYNSFILSGHPYKMNKVTGGQPPLYPYLTPTVKAIDNLNVPNTPEGFDWTDISYVIGGYGWKGRFMDQEGYILTDIAGATGSQLTQWNMANHTWSSYSPSEGGRKPYSCGSCHTTGWEAATAEEIADYENNLAAFQDGLPGIHGTWSEAGVHCEACHGPGEAHANAPSASNIDRILTDAADELTSKRCGECHTRDPQNRILVSGGFIRHHEQYDELLGGSHAALNCVTCHDPHASTKYTPALGVTTHCTDCHADVTVNSTGMADFDCTACHMPAASKSAIAVNPLKADVRTHIFAIHVGTETRENYMFYEDTDGKMVSRGEVTLDFACLGCHNGTDAFALTMEAAAAAAPNIHN